MKKILLTVVALLSFSIAQEASSSPWGIYGGLTSAGSSDSDGRISGLSFGGSYTINEKWSAGAGLSVRGGKYDVQDEESGIEATAELKGDALELWTSYSLMQSESFGLSTGLIYANIYSTKLKFMGLTLDPGSRTPRGCRARGTDRRPRRRRSTLPTARREAAEARCRRRLR